MSSIKNIILLFAAIGLLSGCASGPRTTFRPVYNYDVFTKSEPSEGVVKISKVNYPAHRAGHLKKLEEGDCIPLTPAPHSSPFTERGILRGIS